MSSICEEREKGEDMTCVGQTQKDIVELLRAFRLVGLVLLDSSQKILEEFTRSIPRDRLGFELNSLLPPPRRIRPLVPLREVPRQIFDSFREIPKERLSPDFERVSVTVSVCCREGEPSSSE